jgi:hypothetical protein
MQVMNLEKRIDSFSDLGRILRDSIEGKRNLYSDQLNKLIDSQERHNQFFTPDNVRMAVRAIAEELTIENLTKWTNNYPSLEKEHTPCRIGVVMAGNIPLVGFHDFLTVLISGNNIIARTSSKDSELIIQISEILCGINPEFSRQIMFTEGILQDFDAVIATGSDNTSRYFEYYFGKYPHVIRKNRNSVGIIYGDETDQELQDLGTDIFSYFGLGCRNISKIYLPAGYYLHTMIKNWERFSGIIHHNKYANNYDYNMAIYLVNNERFLDTGYLLLKESKELSSPVSVLYYEYYNSEEKLTAELNNIRNKIQCIAGKKHIPFGKTQFPKLWDFADNFDTLDFLLKKNTAEIL